MRALMSWRTPLLVLLAACVCLAASLPAARAEEQRKYRLFFGLYQTADSGVRITDFAPASPAQQAGLQVGDVIVAVGGTPVAKWDDVLAATRDIPPYTAINLTVRRGGATVEKTVTPTGKVRWPAANPDPDFVIPGVPAPPPAPASAIEALDRINVLQQVIIDPATKKVALIGYYDPQYATGPIPYLDFLKTALKHPGPALNLLATAETNKYYEDLAFLPSGTPLYNLLTLLSGHPTLERERWLVVMNMAALHRLTPAEYAACYNYATIDADGEYAPGNIAAIQLKNLRDFGFTAEADAYALLGRNTPDAAIEALRLLGREAEGRTALARAGGDRAKALDNLLVVAYAALADNLGSSLGEQQAQYDQGKLSRRAFVRQAQNSLLAGHRKGEPPANVSQFGAIADIDLTAATAKLLMDIPVDCLVRIEPVNLDGASQLARVMYAADYAIKSLGNKPELFAAVPGYISNNKYLAAKFPDGFGYRSHLWIEPRLVELNVSPDRQMVAFGKAEMVINWKHLPKPGQTVAEAHSNTHFDDWSAAINSGYGAYAKIIPVFHEIRETAKIIALVKWLNDEKLTVDLSDIPQEKWAAPATVPGTWTLTLGVKKEAVAKGTKETLLFFKGLSGGCSFRPGNWTSITPAPEAQTKAFDQLAASAHLGNQAAQAALGGDLEKAKYLAELSAQAMIGKLGKTDLAKLNIQVPEAKIGKVSPAQVELQKGLIRETYQQITAAPSSPQARENLGKLGAVYAKVQADPGLASDFFYKLQTRQLYAGAYPDAATAPGGPIAPKADAPAVTPCGGLEPTGGSLTAARQEYMNRKLQDARARLQRINDALRKLIALNASQRAELDSLTADITKDYDAAKERAWDFVMATLVDLPFDAYGAVFNDHVKVLDDRLKALAAPLATSLSPADRAKAELAYKNAVNLKTSYVENFNANANILAVYKGAGYGNDILKWEQETKKSPDYKRATDATLLAGKILLDHPALEEFLSKKDWFAHSKIFGNNQLWQVAAMGKMASFASGFFWDIMDQQLAWGPLADQLRTNLAANVQAMEKLREKAAKSHHEIECLEKALK